MVHFWSIFHAENDVVVRFSLSGLTSEYW